MVPLAEIPGFSKEPRDLMPAAVAQSAEARKAEADRLLQQGIQQFNISQFREALQSWEQALAIYRDIQDRGGEGRALRNLGIAYRNLGNYRQAIDFHEQHLAIVREIGDRAREVLTLNNIGSMYDRLGDYPKALEFFQQELALRREMGDHIGEGTTLSNIGIIYSNLSNYPKALESYQQALNIFHEIGDRAGEGTTLTGIGLTYYRLGDYPKALEFYQQALVISREIGDRAGEGTTLTGIGVVYSNFGDYSRALEFYQQALIIFREIGDPAAEGTTLGNFGQLYFSLGDYSKALEFYEQALIIFREAGNLAWEGTTLDNIGTIYERLNNYPKALELFQQALDISRASSNRSGEANSLGNIGGVYDHLGDYPKALEFFQRSLDISREIGNRFGEGGSLNNIGTIYDRLGNYPKALEFFQQSLGIFRDIGHRAEEGNSLGNIGFVLGRQEQTELAITFLKASVDVRESIRGDIRSLGPSLQQSFTDTVADTYRTLADLLLQQDRILEAQRVLDLLKVQELDESLRGVRSSADTASGVAFWQVETNLLALYDQVIADSDELAQLQTADYDSLSPEQQQRLATLRQRYGDAQSRFTAFLDLTEVKELLDSIREETDGQNLDIERQHRALQNNLRRLPQKTALLYPLILPDRLELVLVTADGPPLRYPIDIKGEDLNRAIVAFGQALKDPRSDIQPLAQQLYTWLVAPLEPQLEQAGIESLLYAPDGALRYVPLAALHDGEQYLAQRFSLSHITAASLTNFDQVPNAEGRRLLAAACAECSFTVNVGGATFPFGDLPYTETEVNALAEQMPNTSVLLNQGFSRRELENRLGSYSIIHLATHGAVVENQPSQSFVVMGSGEHVTLEAIRQSWSLSHAELVVLSACETAVGSPQLGSGVEILGLGYQIQEAGALAVLASLWKVSDQGTQVLMSAFYDALGQGMTKAQALQAAQNALITGDFSAVGGDRATIELIRTATGQPLVAGGSLAHPYYWAPFILIGNGL
jgi:CHAT domain-containing protein/tetratricopeptide (TPR) repeat protein